VILLACQDLVDGKSIPREEKAIILGPNEDKGSSEFEVTLHDEVDFVCLTRRLKGD
jgi:hypothetical protein